MAYLFKEYYKYFYFFRFKKYGKINGASSKALSYVSGDLENHISVGVNMDNPLAIAKSYPDE